MDCPLSLAAIIPLQVFLQRARTTEGKPLQEKGKHFTFCAILQVADNTLMRLHLERRNCSSKLELSLLTGTLFSIGYCQSWMPTTEMAQHKNNQCGP